MKKLSLITVAITLSFWFYHDLCGMISCCIGQS